MLNSQRGSEIEPCETVVEGSSFERTGMAERVCCGSELTAMEDGERFKHCGNILSVLRHSLKKDVQRVWPCSHRVATSFRKLFLNVMFSKFLLQCWASN